MIDSIASVWLLQHCYSPPNLYHKYFETAATKNLVTNIFHYVRLSPQLLHLLFQKGDLSVSLTIFS